MRRFTNLGIFCMFLSLISNQSALAQKKNDINGRVINEFTKDLVPFASIQWKKAGWGITSDSIGNFKLRVTNFLDDTLIVSYVGFEPNFYPFSIKKDTGIVTLQLSRLLMNEGVQVKTKFNKGLRWWKNIVSHKLENNPYKYQQYACELYNKMEVDINNVNRESFQKIKILRPFSFLLDNIDSVTEQRPFLPVFMTETLSDYYYSSDPTRIREEIKAAQMHGIKNETILQFISGANQKVNMYQDFMKLFGKEFISPISSFADKYYRFKGADTQLINGDKYFHLFFSPLRDGENTFLGDCWIHATTWAIQKITLHLSSSADINFVNRLSIIQEFNKMESGQWIFYKDKMVIDMSPFKKDKFTFIVRKSATYNQIRTNTEEVENAIALNSKSEESIVVDGAKVKDAKYWDTYRPEALSANEQKIFKMIDTLKTVPVFQKYMRNAEFLIDGYRKLGKVEIGPWFKWFSGNRMEGLRFRFDLGTTDKFSKYIRLNTYVAYGLKDQNFKYKFAVAYKIPGNTGWGLQASFINDLDNGRVRFNDEDVTTDHIFSQLIRRPGIPQKFLGIKEFKTSISKDWNSGFSYTLSLARTDYEAYSPLPKASHFRNGNIDPLINTELMLRFRYAAGERKIITNRKTIRLKSNIPVYELRLVKGVAGLFKGEYDYEKVQVGVSQQFRIPRFGKVAYNVYGGEIFGEKLPFMLLELHPGNEFYAYNKNGFNLMNRFEYFSDRYIGFQLEHDLEKKILNLLPFMRKSRMRQFWTLKGVWGDMSTANRKFNKTELGSYQLRSLMSHTYVEYGTGLDNIFGFFRIDFLWRKAPPLPVGIMPSKIQPAQNFGVFGSVRFQF
jgi:hypothetical protein